LGHPSKFQRVSRLGSVTARHSSSGRQPNFAVLNRGRNLYSAGRPSRWALAHISYLVLVFSFQSLLSCRAKFWYLSTFSCFCCVPGTAISIKRECRIVVLLYDYNILSSVFNHVVHLHTYIPEDCEFLRLYRVSLVQRYDGTIVPNASGHTSHITESSRQSLRLGYVSSYTLVVPACCMHHY